MLKQITLLNLLTNSKYANTFFSDVNFNLITKITCKSETSKTKFKSYDPVSNEYVEYFTDLENIFVFDIYIKNIFKPIQVICLNSQKLDPEDLGSYHYRGNSDYINELVNQSYLSQFITNLSTNKLSYILSYMGFVLGHLVNNNLDKLGFEIN